MSFAKHETFYIREGWLFKGMAAIVGAQEREQLPTIFQDADAPEQLGIGRNMVRALRFWMQATGLAEERLEQRQRTQRLTPLGRLVWQYDRYLEETDTLWLIHYQLACSHQHATTWYWFFNHFAPATFDQHTCLEALRNWVISTFPDQEFALSSLEKDIDCLLKTYLFDGTSRVPEDLRESPLSRLGLLSSYSDGNKKQYRLERTDSASLDPRLVLYVLLDRQLQNRTTARQVRLGEVLREPMNVGRVFNLTATTLIEVLKELNVRYPDYSVQFVRTEGLDDLTLPVCTPAEVLSHYYIQRVLAYEAE